MTNKTFRVTAVYSAWASQNINADSTDEAMDAFDNRPNLCYHCSRELELGDVVMSMYVEDMEGNVICEEDYSAEEALRNKIANLEAEIERLEGVVK